MVGFSKMKFVMSDMALSAHHGSANTRSLLTWHIHPGILHTAVSQFTESKRVAPTHAFAGHVQLLALQFLKHFQELLHKSHDLRRNVVLVLYLDMRHYSPPRTACTKNTHGSVWLPLREARSDRLLDEEDTGQVRPAKLVLRGVCLAPRPRERLYACWC